MLVFDATALAALFDAYPPIWALWHRADHGHTQLGLPVAAIIEAGQMVEASVSAWEFILQSTGVTVLPLMERAAVEISAWSGVSLAARQSMWEAQALNCPLVTRDASLYTPGIVPIIVL
ncbi:hypothetical protein [Dactylosporangium maewongense]|uniref:hypothetical protein n=1 Tax=Dactylosporangium maewongense TaxID=634393 RepID=UPI0031E3C939